MPGALSTDAPKRPRDRGTHPGGHRGGPGRLGECRPAGIQMGKTQGRDFKEGPAVMQVIKRSPLKYVTNSKISSVPQGIFLCEGHPPLEQGEPVPEPGGPGFCLGIAASSSAVHHVLGRPALNSRQFCTETWGCWGWGSPAPGPPHPIAIHIPAHPVLLPL